MKRTLNTLLLLCLTSSISITVATPLDEFKAAIRQQYDLKERAFEADDAELVVNKFYTEDAVAVFPDGTVLEGREQFLTHYRRVIGARLKIRSGKVRLAGNAGWDWSNTTIYPQDAGSEPIDFIMLFLWEKREGEWRCAGYTFSPGKIN